MSGHSHFSSIKHKKAITDAKRGKIFSKLAKQISIVAKEKGGDPEANSSLKMAIEKAKSFNMPKENIERAIKRGTGDVGGAKLEEFIFEAYGPNKIAIIIQGITDNKNRALGEIKQILAKNNGKLAAQGSVKWLFERKGVITINPKSTRAKGSSPQGCIQIIPNQIQNPKSEENLELIAIEAGAEDIHWHDAALYIYTKPEELEKTKKNLENQEIKIESVSLDWVAKDEVELNEKEKQTAEKLFEALDENDDIQEIYSNLRT